MDDLTAEIIAATDKRRTFAIISHPDAGKTTLTEKLLLFGGAIRLAGEVKGRKAKKFATSDWMEIEKQRGISVTSSAMQFEFSGYKINILDTPGHQDFSEDTYRTLAAADSAVMIIDAARGVEAQTIKLFQVCRQRQIPIFTFINKMDRYGKEPLDLLQELEDVLGIRSCPMNWPVGMGEEFRGIFDRRKNRFELYVGDDHDHTQRQFIPLVRQQEEERDFDHDQLSQYIDKHQYNRFVSDMELLDIAGDPFDEEQVRQGLLTPVFFGSAINKFGVQTFLDEFIALAPKPQAHMSDQGPVEVTAPFSGFIFKIQANMNPAHHDRIAFLRVCSGKFARGMLVNHVRSAKKIKLAQPQQFLSQERTIVQEGFPGDIIGLYDQGTLFIGDTLSLAGDFQFAPLPQFAPEIFAQVVNLNTSKYKQFLKGIHELVQEGVVQLFTMFNRTEDLLLGAVGQLQFEVFAYRMQNEYGASIRLEPLKYQLARWVHNLAPDHMEQLTSLSSLLVQDRHGQSVVLCENEYNLHWLEGKYPELTFAASNYK